MKEQLIKEITNELVERGLKLFYTICSAHRDKEKDCNNCQIGSFRNVTLEDVFIAIDKRHNGCDFITVSSNGFIQHFEEWCVWQLGKPLHEQSIETLQFIKGIIK